ncbi:MAG: ferritin-like domain-containing protein [Chthoniobacterales bacterium]
MQTKLESMLATDGLSRRQALRNLGLGAVGLTALGALAKNVGAAPNPPVTARDGAIGQFALNLEYLEAEFYTYAVFGTGIESQGIAVDGSGTPGTVTIKSNPKVPFSDPKVEQYAREIGGDERNHVKLFRGFLSAAGAQPVARPKIDLLNSFNTLANAAGIGPAFDPFADDVSFLLGAFIFEDVGVTLFGGAAKLLANKDLLDSAAGVLAVEAYHAGNIRVNIFSRGTAQNKAIENAQKVSDVRKMLSGADDDQGVVDSDGNANIVPVDSMGRAFRRTTRQGLNIVYGAVNATKGLFFPNGLNGPISS